MNFVKFKLKNIFLNKNYILLMLSIPIIIYFNYFLFFDNSPNIFFIICLTTGVAGSLLLFLYLSNKNSLKNKKKLEELIKNPPGYTYTIYNNNGAKIGNIKENDYFNAEYLYKKDNLSFLLQGLNVFWIAWTVLIKLLVTVPAILLAYLFSIVFLGQADKIADLTIGYILININPSIVFNIFVSTMIIYFVIHLIIRKPLPGYKNYRGILFKKILSNYLPNIANANGYKIRIRKKK
jgi:hypothetical protein